MAKVESSMLPLGTLAPDFTLTDTISGQPLTLNHLKSSLGTVIIFLCNHCPFVKHMLHELVSMAYVYRERGLQFIAISANDVDNYPADAPDKMRALALAERFPFPYLYDETQVVAKAYHAECTPDFFVFDSQLACVYRGRFDDSTPGNKRPVTGHDLRLALEAVLAGEKPDANQQPSMGCNIKWKQNEQQNA